MSFLTSAIAPTVTPPQPRNLTNEIMQTYNGLASTAPGFYGLESTYQPLYNQMSLDLMRQQMEGYDVPPPATSGTGTTTPPPATGGTGAPGTPPPSTGGGGGRIFLGSGKGTTKKKQRYGDLTAQYPASATPSQTPGHHMGTLELASLQRGHDIADVSKYGPQAVAAYLQANPWLKSGLDSLLARTSDSPILSSLNTDAQKRLALNGQLSPQEQVDLAQQTEGGFAKRGMLGGNQSLAADVLSRDAAVRSRQLQDEQFATQVQGLNQGQNEFVRNATGTFGAALADPYQMVLGRGSGASAVPPPISTSQMFNPLNSYSQDLFNTNYNGQAAAGIANANNQAAITSAFISSIGQAVGGLGLSDRRVKRDIKTVGQTGSGIRVVAFRYKTDKTRKRYRGVLAQDVEKVAPHAVVTDRRSGMKAVDYSKIDAPFDLISGPKRLAKAA